MGAILIATGMAGFAIGIALILFIIPGVILAVLFAFIIQGIIIDNLEVMDALGKSIKVAKEAFSEVLILVVMSVFAMIVLSVIPFIGLLLSSVVTGFFTVVLTVMYYYNR